MYFFYIHAAIECPPLPGIDNGVISYAADTVADYMLGTVATYTCNAGFFLDISAAGSSATRTCVDDNDNDAEGIFDRQPPTCIRKYISTVHACLVFYRVLSFSLQLQIVWFCPLFPME